MVYYKIPAILSQNIKKPNKKVWYFERYLKTGPFDRLPFEYWRHPVIVISVLSILFMLRDLLRD